MNNRNKINRGKTGADLPPAMQATEKGLVAGSRDEVAHSAGRPPRISMANMKKLSIPDAYMKEGYYHRWVQDRNGGVANAHAAYYEHVTDEQGNNLTHQSGKYTMYAMRLKQQYRDEDDILRKRRASATMDSESAIGPGEYAPDRKTGRPDGGRSAISRDIM